MNKQIKCPECSQEITLVQKPENPWRLVAYHNCGGRGSRPVYETDASQISIQEEGLQSSEEISLPSESKKKRS